MIFLELFVIACLLTAAYAGFRAAPWWPTHQVDLERVLKLADLQPGQTVYELGCGDGRLLTEMAKRTSAKQLVGYEISLLFYLIARWRSLGQKNIQIQFQDFWHADLRHADLVYVFLTPRIHERLRQKLERELKPSARVICYTWPIEGWVPIHVDHVTARTLYVYQRPF